MRYTRIGPFKFPTGLGIAIVGVGVLAVAGRGGSKTAPKPAEGGSPTVFAGEVLFNRLCPNGLNTSQGGVLVNPRDPEWRFPSGLDLREVSGGQKHQLWNASVPGLITKFPVYVRSNSEIGDLPFAGTKDQAAISVAEGNYVCRGIER